MGLDVDKIVGTAPALLTTLNAANIISTTDVTVLVQGESGTGKELLAKALHMNSRRANRPMVAINCAALSKEFIESELFGHKKGAFPGADKDQLGRIPAAHGGTLFLDEISELPITVQAKLLRFIETGEYLPIGGSHPSRIDVRIIATTNKNLADMVAENTFRKDLYFRLNVVPLELPPLRKRQQDVALLAKYFFDQFAREYAMPVPRMSETGLKLLKAYTWPGNVRELRNLCQRLTILLPGQEITPENLPAEFSSYQKSPRISVTSLVEVEVAMLRRALEENASNQSKAARALGLSRDAFLYRLKKYGLR